MLPRPRRRSPFLDNRRPRHLYGTSTGAVAQMGERCNRTAEVRGSIPLGSTNKSKHLLLSRSDTLRLSYDPAIALLSGLASR